MEELLRLRESMNKRLDELQEESQRKDNDYRVGKVIGFQEAYIRVLDHIKSELNK